MTEEKDLTDLAREAVGRNITTGREKLSATELAKAYPGGVHIDGVDIIDNKGSDFLVFTFTEDQEHYLQTGAENLRKMLNSWLEFFDGDIDAINDRLQKKPVYVVISVISTKNTNNYVLVKVIKEREVADNVSGE